MSFRKISFVITIASLLFISFANTSVFASGYGTNCEPIYGGGNTCDSNLLVVDKLVRNPKDGQYVNHLTVNDPKFAPNDEISFLIRVRNISSSSLSSVTLTDTLPQYVTAVSNIDSYNKTTNMITIAIGKLNQNETKEIELRAKVASTESFPKTVGILCLSNNAKATSDTLSGSDVSQFCIDKTLSQQTKGGLPIYGPQQVLSTPPTGATTISLTILSISMISGLSLLNIFTKRKTA